jgi:hypothetical protein
MPHSRGADMRSELEQLEHKFERAQEELGRIGAHSKSALHEIERAIRTLLSELRIGYERIRGQR